MSSRIRIVVALLLVTGAGLALKLLSPPGSWCNAYGAGVAYEIFWVLAAGLIFRSASAWKCALAVFLITCALEILQPWHPGWLETARATFLGAALLGGTFDWLDFPHYAAGSALGGWILNRARRPKVPMIGKSG